MYYQNNSSIFSAEIIPRISNVFPLTRFEMALKILTYSLAENDRSKITLAFLVSGRNNRENNRGLWSCDYENTALTCVSPFVGPVLFPPGPPPNSAETSGVIVGASGYGFVPPSAGNSFARFWESKEIPLHSPPPPKKEKKNKRVERDRWWNTSRRAFTTISACKTTQRAVEDNGMSRKRREKKKERKGQSNTFYHAIPRSRTSALDLCINTIYCCHLWNNIVYNTHILPIPEF